MFHPSHHPHNNSLTPWNRDGQTIGYARAVESPENVWLMLHGNAGQASDRLYAVPCFSEKDAVFILEYPGYGDREGRPSITALNQAAENAFRGLRKTYPDTPVCVAAESIGSGPASYLASLSDKPDKLVLIVPFDNLALVAKERFPGFLVRLILTDNWDNVALLSGYKGPVDVFGAKADTVFHLRHARALAESIPGARLVLVDGGHNDWSCAGRVKIRNP